MKSWSVLCCKFFLLILLKLTSQFKKKEIKKLKKKWTSERKRGFNFLALHVEQQTDNLEMFLRKTLTAIFLLAIIFLF